MSENTKDTKPEETKPEETSIYEYLEIGSDVILRNYLSPSYDE